MRLARHTGGGITASKSESGNLDPSSSEGYWVTFEPCGLADSLSFVEMTRGWPGWSVNGTNTAVAGRKKRFAYASVTHKSERFICYMYRRPIFNTYLMVNISQLHSLLNWRDGWYSSWARHSTSLTTPGSITYFAVDWRPETHCSNSHSWTLLFKLGLMH